MLTSSDNSLTHGYPKLRETIDCLATPLGKKYLSELNGKDACLVEHEAKFANINYSSPAVFKGGNIEQNPVVQSVLAQQSLLQNVSSLHVPVPKIPRFEWHGLADTTVPYLPEKEYVEQQCCKYSWQVQDWQNRTALTKYTAHQPKVPTSNLSVCRGRTMVRPP